MLIGLVIFALRKELKLLDVIALGKNQAINLGVDVVRQSAGLIAGRDGADRDRHGAGWPISFLGLIIANLSRAAV